MHLLALCTATRAASGCAACRQGAHVLQPGELIGPAEMGILATVGVVRVPVHRRPQVAITSTGDEVSGCVGLRCGLCGPAL
jgi:molybdopterin biosynthesis enzyme